MPIVRKTITLTDDQDDWIKSQIEAGHYINGNECIRDLIWRDQRHYAQVESIREALREGDTSGEPKAISSESLKLRCWLRLAKHLPAQEGGFDLGGDD